MPQGYNTFSGGQGREFVDLAETERVSRRLYLLEQHLPGLAHMDPTATLGLAQSFGDDNQMLADAAATDGYSQIEQFRAQLAEEEPTAARALFLAAPRPIQDTLTNMGFELPEEEQRHAKFGINFPDQLPFIPDWADPLTLLPNELTAQDRMPVVGTIFGGAQHFLGEGLESTLHGLTWLGDQPAHVIRAQNYEQEVLGRNPRAGSFLDQFSFLPAVSGEAWAATADGDDYIRPDYLDTAQRKLAADPEITDPELALEVAKDLSAGKTLEDMLVDRGLEPGSDASNLFITQYQVLSQKPDLLNPTLDELDEGKVSWGRLIAGGVGLDQTSEGLGAWVSGSLDAAFVWFADPTLAMGKAKGAFGAGRWAFHVSQGNRGLEDASKLLDVATGALRKRGHAGGEILAQGLAPNRVERWRGIAVARAAEEISGAFADQSFAVLRRRHPDWVTAMSRMQDYHIKAVTQGRQGLDEAQGVINFLRHDAGIMTMADTALGGRHTLKGGLVIPAMSRAQVATSRVRQMADELIDWGRYSEREATMGDLESLPKEILSSISDEERTQLERILRRAPNEADAAAERLPGEGVDDTIWRLARWVGNTIFLKPFDLAAGLTRHTPYVRSISLHGDDAVEQYQRLLNTGIFAGIPPQLMDDMFNAFVVGNQNQRSFLVTMYLNEMFTRAGISDSDFARKFIQRNKQAYTAGQDNISLFGYAGMLDSQHSGMMSIPRARDFLKESRRYTRLRRFRFSGSVDWADAAIGKTWKPAVLMRIGFIPRAAGEELLHFILKHGSLEYAKKVSAGWHAREAEGQVLEEIVQRYTDELIDLHSLEGSSPEAIEAVGRKLVRAQRAVELQRHSDLLAPVTALMRTSDRMWTKLAMSAEPSSATWRQRLAAKSAALDEHGVVSGLEKMAQNMQMAAGGGLEKLGQLTRLPTKGEIGQFLNRNDTQTLRAARIMLTDPTFKRVLAESIGAGTMTPLEMRPATILHNGVPTPTIRVKTWSGGQPVIKEVPLTQEAGVWGMSSSRVPQELDRFYAHSYEGHRRMYADRVGHELIRSTRRFVSPELRTKLTSELGDDLTEIRSRINRFWHDGENPELLHRWRMRTTIPTDQLLGAGEDAEDVAQLAARTKTALKLSGWTDDQAKAMAAMLADPMLDHPTRHWLLYDDVSSDNLIEDWDQLESTLYDEALARLSMPDMFRQLREHRPYELNGELTAGPPIHGMTDIYVPTLKGQMNEVNWFDPLVQERLIANLTPLVGADEATAMAARLQSAPTGIQSGQAFARPAAMWGSTDPRIVQAVADAAMQGGQKRLGFGVLRVPDEVVQTSAGKFPSGVTTSAKNWKEARDFNFDVERGAVVRHVSDDVRYARLKMDGEWWDEDEFLVAADKLAEPPASGHMRFYRGQIDEMGGGPAQSTYTGEAIRPERQPLVGMWWTDDPNYAATYTNGVEGVDEQVAALYFVDVPLDTAVDRYQPRLLREEAEMQGLYPDEQAWLFRNEDLAGLPVHRVPAKDIEAHRMGLEMDEAGNVVQDQWWKVGYGAENEDLITARVLSGGMNEQSAREAIAQHAVKEVLDTLTTKTRDDQPNDVLHEVLEALSRPDVTTYDEMGDRVLELGYGLDDLQIGASLDRLPIVAYGPERVAKQEMRFSAFPQEWFSGAVGPAISAVVRKPLFLTQFSHALAETEGVARLMVDKRVVEAMEGIYKRLDLAPNEGEELFDQLIMAWDEIGSPDIDMPVDFISERLGTALGREDPLKPLAKVGPEGEQMMRRSDIEFGRRIGELEPNPYALSADEVGTIRHFVNQRRWALQLARDNAMQKAIHNTIPFIDDHAVRSAFQEYVGNFVPFWFAEEQFLKRWARSVIESPEMIRKAQLYMNGLRAMGTVRKDEDGNEIFVYPGGGAIVDALGPVMSMVMGHDMRVPFPVEMTGDVRYVLPGLGDQMGVPSVGPLVAIPLTLAARRYPELETLESQVLGPRGTKRSIWQYLIPSQMATLANAMWGDIGTGELASASLQAAQIMAANGQLPPENATPEQKEEFLDRARSQARIVVAARALFGLNVPASPQVNFTQEQMAEPFMEAIRSGLPFEEAVANFLAAHPDADVNDLVNPEAFTVFQSETPSGAPLGTPTEASETWMSDNAALLRAFPSAAPWLMPGPDADDPFSSRAYFQQMAHGLRKRKGLDEFVGDMYFAEAAPDYFDAQQMFEGARQAVPEWDSETRRAVDDSWRTWKEGYFNQHPLFTAMLSDPSRHNRRRTAWSEMRTLVLSSDERVPASLAELVRAYDGYLSAVRGLRGDARSMVVSERRRMTEGFAAWAEWWATQHREIIPFWMRVIRPELGLVEDDDAVSADELVTR